MVQFGTLHPDGSLTDVVEIPQVAIAACPHFILVAEHYRPDGTCRCDDAGHDEMQLWGYAWRGGCWR